MKIKHITTLFFIALSIMLTSCDEGGDPDGGGTNTRKFAGDWYISIFDADGNELIPNALHATYNTAANNNTMWIDDNPQHAAVPNGWFLKVKITFDMENGTFTATTQPNIGDLIDNPADPDGPQIPNGTVTITEGKIEKNAALSQGGHTVDKISFKAVFSYDPGTILTFVGHKRTGFLEDEY